MTNEQVLKELSKMRIEHMTQSLGDTEREMLKQAVDQSQNIGELMATLLLAMKIAGDRYES